MMNIPAFTSRLIRAPLIHAMLPPGKVIGVFTEPGHHMNDGRFRGVGWSQQQIPVQVQGMKPDAQFRRAILEIPRLYGLTT